MMPLHVLERVLLVTLEKNVSEARSSRAYLRCFADFFLVYICEFIPDSLYFYSFALLL